MTDLLGAGRAAVRPHWGLISCALGPCLLGTAFLATQQLPATPLWNAVERVLPAGAALLALRPALPRGPWWARSLGLGVLNFGAFFALQAVASHRLPGAVVSTITAVQALLVPLLVGLFGERIQPRQVGAAALGVFGVVLLVVRADHRLDPTGVGAAAVLAGSAALGLLLTRRWGAPQGVHHLAATAWQMLAGGATLIPLALGVEGLPPAMTSGQTLAAAWLALAATAGAFALFFGGLHHGVPPATVSRLALLSPLVAAALGWAVAEEALTAAQLAGIVLILGAQLVGSPRPATTTIQSGNDSPRRTPATALGPDVDRRSRDTVPVAIGSRPDTCQHVRDPRPVCEALARTREPVMPWYPSLGMLLPAAWDPMAEAADLDARYTGLRHRERTAGPVPTLTYLLGGEPLSAMFMGEGGHNVPGLFALPDLFPGLASLWQSPFRWLGAPRPGHNLVVCTSSTHRTCAQATSTAVLGVLVTDFHAGGLPGVITLSMPVAASERTADHSTGNGLPHTRPRDPFWVKPEYKWTDPWSAPVAPAWTWPAPRCPCWTRTTSRRGAEEPRSAPLRCTRACDTWLHRRFIKAPAPWPRRLECQCL